MGNKRRESDSVSIIITATKTSGTWPKRLANSTQRQIAAYRPPEFGALPCRNCEPIRSRAEFVARASPKELAVHGGVDTDIARRLHADLDQPSGMGHRAFDKLLWTQVGPHHHAGEARRRRIHPEHGAHQFDIRTRAPGVAIRPRRPAGTDRKSV